MYCRKCGKELEETDRACYNCGEEVDDKRLNLVSLKCKNCGAQLKIAKDSDMLYCEYCGSKIYIDDDASKEKRIGEAKLKLKKEMDEHDLEHQKKMDTYKQDQEYKSKKSNGKIKVWSFVLLVFTGFLLIGAIESRAWISLGIGIAQMILFLVTILLCFDIIPEIKKNTYKVVFVLGCILIFPFFSFVETSFSYKEKFTWSNSDVASLIPAYSEEMKGYVYSDTDERFDIEIDNVSKNEYRDYIRKCKNAGFNIDPQEDYSFTSYNEDGYKLEICHYSDDRMRIEVNSPKKFDNITWPVSELTQDLPMIPSKKGNISVNGDNYAVIILDDVTEEDFNNYIEKCKKAGYNEKYSQDTHDYDAYKGYKKLDLQYEADRYMTIRLQYLEYLEKEGK